MSAGGPPLSSGTGTIQAWSGSDGSLLYEFANSPPGYYFLTEMAALGDVDQDGTPDFVHQAIAEQGGTDPLVALVRSGHQLLLPDLGNALAGSYGEPQLVGESSLHRKTPLLLDLAGAPPASPVTLVAGASPALAPFKGGVLVPFPHLLVPLSSDAAGELHLETTVTWILPPGTTLWLQAWMADPGGPAGYAASNALALIAP